MQEEKYFLRGRENILEEVLLWLNVYWETFASTNFPPNYPYYLTANYASVDGGIVTPGLFYTPATCAKHCRSRGGHEYHYHILMLKL